MNRRRLAGSGVLLLALAALAAIVPRLVGAMHPSAGAHTTATRTAAKRFCPEAAPKLLVDGLQPSSHLLVPLSATLLGTQASWRAAGGARSLTVISGGYVDDITEAYDNLHPDRSTTVVGVPASVLTTVFLHERVWIAFWRQPSIPPPCDVHAAIANGLGRSQFYTVLRGFSGRNTQ